MQRMILLLAILLTGGLYTRTCHAEAPACATDVTLLQATISTPARVTGAPGEHLVLRPVHPKAQDDSDIAQGKPMYVITGDSVEQIATCGKYAFVRYQGHAKVSTGWVTRARLEITGAPHSRPKDTVAQVCEAANRIVNAATTPFGLHELRPQIDMKVLRRMATMKASQTRDLPTESVRIEAEGRMLSVVSIQDGGTCGSNYMQVWQEDGNKPLTNTMPDYSQGAYMGDQQEMVEVLGHPLVMEYVQNFPNSFTLAALDKQGKQTRLCSIKRDYAAPSRYLAHSHSALCRAVVTDQAHVVDMKAGDLDALHFPSKRNPSSYMRMSLSTTLSKVNLMNDGTLREVGLVHAEYDSTAGCGSAAVVTVPVIVNAQGKVDMGASENRKLIELTTGASTLDGESDYPRSGRLVTVDGHVYYLMYVKYDLAGDQSPTQGLQDVMQFTKNGSSKVCSYQPYVYRVKPIDGLKDKVLP